MKIFYAIQATGNGHISRASELYPILQKYGKIDFFLSGSNYGLKTALPIAFRSKGMSLEYNVERGSIDLRKTLSNVKLRKVLKEARQLPLENYDLIINDFDFTTSLACLLKGLPSVHLGHQASFQSKYVPRPKEKDFIGEWVLKNFVRAQQHFGFHFKQYDRNIYTPIIKSAVLQAETTDQGHITVYLSQYSMKYIYNILSTIRNFKFHVFTSEVQQIHEEKNIIFYPLSGELFTKSMIHSMGVITGAGFETPAEALYLNKKLLVIPLKGQYEQLCNAEALKEFNVFVSNGLDHNFSQVFQNWIEFNNQLSISTYYTTASIIESVFTSYFENMNSAERSIELQVPQPIFH